METLGVRIKQLRNKLTQEELAAILQVDRSTLASWEVNRREPDIATLCRIAAFFKVSVDWLVGYQPQAGGMENTGHFRESAAEYCGKDEEWRQVVATAQRYGCQPDDICQLLELNAKIARHIKPSSV